ncbi:potassium-transporting ATPase subunit KdpC [Nakamurella antarctica]|uniref:potassium-transporting ATPase subunit KdpC n=1 Tax=Nakamurella antarctica TaxID=1902245 RepID=UPI0019D2C5F7|nr:potassium-transporting ATPase subunit KdpC [Nakamurella antarctica]
MSRFQASVRPYGVALRAMLVLTVGLGLLYPLVILGIGQTLFNKTANGSLVTVGDRAVGSSLIGQSFSDTDGNPLPQFFQPRPSAAGNGYDSSASGGSNFGPENADLIAAITKRKAEIAAFNNVDPASIPADALTASSSGLDPDISKEYALLQANRVAAARGIPLAQMQALVTDHIASRNLGFLGEETVNVLELNIALEQIGG